MIESIIKHFFLPAKARYRMYIVFPMLNLLVLSIVLLFLKAPKEAILLSMAAISFVVFLMGSERFVFLFYISSIAFNLLVFFVTWSKESSWQKGWSLSMMLTLTLGFYLTKEVLTFFINGEKESKEDKNEKILWKNRFETLRDAHNLETLGLEEDISKCKIDLQEKDSQIKALEKLVEVTHKEASILSKTKHELMEKLKCSSDQRNDEQLIRQNLALEKELGSLRSIQRDALALREEKNAFLDTINALQEQIKELEKLDQADQIISLKEEIEQLKNAAETETKGKGYTALQIVAMVKDLDALKTEEDLFQKISAELKAKLDVLDKPFKWQVWKGEKKEKKETNNKISMLDLGKGLKI
jgi:hypothetical protein